MRVGGLDAGVPGAGGGGGPEWAEQGRGDWSATQRTLKHGSGPCLAPSTFRCSINISWKVPEGYPVTDRTCMGQSCRLAAVRFGIASYDKLEII